MRLMKVGGRHLERHGRVGLAPRVLHGVRAGAVGAQRHHGQAGAVDHDGGNGVAARLAGLERVLGNRLGDPVGQILALDELRAGRRRDHARERHHCDKTHGRPRCVSGQGSGIGDQQVPDA